MPALDGIINLDKPAGLSSARVVDRVKRLLPRGTKIGHAGTLDPFATGVLLLLVGKATKLCEPLMGAPKQYLATVKLGAVTATEDPDSPEGPWVPPAGHAPRDLATEPLTAEEAARALPPFVGDIRQRPPAFSALKVAGRRAYDLARQGLEVVLEERVVRVYGIELLDFAWPLARLRVDCGRGTYVRSLARDWGAALRVGGHLRELSRTRVGPFHLAAAVSIEQLTADGIGPHLHPPAANAGS